MSNAMSNRLCGITFRQSLNAGARPITTPTLSFGSVWRTSSAEIEPAAVASVLCGSWSRTWRPIPGRFRAPTRGFNRFSGVQTGGAARVGKFLRC